MTVPESTWEVSRPVPLLLPGPGCCSPRPRGPCEGVCACLEGRVACPPQQLWPGEGPPGLGVRLPGVRSGQRQAGSLTVLTCRKGVRSALNLERLEPGAPGGGPEPRSPAAASHSHLLHHAPCTLTWTRPTWLLPQPHWVLGSFPSSQAGGTGSGVGWGPAAAGWDFEGPLELAKGKGSSRGARTWGRPPGSGSLSPVPPGPAPAESVPW